MPRRFLGLELALAAAFSIGAAAESSSVASLIVLVRRSIARNEADGKLAGELRKLSLVQRLDDRTIEELESEGAGPKSVAELLDLRDASAGQPAAELLPTFSEPLAPGRSEREEILHAAAANAASYTSGLPDFLCTEVIHRYQDTGTGWKLKDTLQVKLTYFNRKEKYQLASVDGRATNREYDFQSLGGAVSQGEFGSDLLTIFVPTSKTTLQWDHWTHLRKRAAHVFSYRIERANSRYRLDYMRPGSDPVHAVAGQSGYIYVDADTRQILRLNRSADPPIDFPIRRASTLLDYDFVEIGGRRFLLPLRAETRMATDSLLTRNQIEFTGYRKFEGESKITFDQK